MRSWSLSLACALALLATAPASAMDPRVPILTEEAGAKTKIAQFEKACAGQPEVLAALKAAESAPVRDRIHRALQAIPAYAKAVEGFEQSGDNAEAWQALLDSDAASSPFLRAHATYFLGRSLLARDELGGAAAALEEVRGRLREGTPWTDEATLYLGYVYARLPELGGRHAVADRARAQRALTSLVGDEQAQALYPDAPERVREGATWMLRELAGEGMGPLLELAKRMETIERMLDRTATGKGTQVRQEKVISEIDRLIALMREKEKSCSGGGQGKGGRPSSKSGKAGGSRSSAPAKDSSLPGGDGPDGEMAKGNNRSTSEKWGELRDREREEAMQFLRERFPSRYKEQIEKYYKALAEQDQDK